MDGRMECLYVIKNDLLLFVLILNVEMYRARLALCSGNKFISLSSCTLSTMGSLDIIIMYGARPV